ncbi:unnamed protein product, partial [Prorocentrum cordatum]
MRRGHGKPGQAVLQGDPSRLQEKPLRLECTPVQIADVVRDVLRFCEQCTDRYGRPLKRRGVHLSGNLGRRLPVIEADAQRCAQLVFNLVVNALQATHTGHVRVSAVSDDSSETLTLLVEDTGTGIPRGKIDSLFRPIGGPASSGRQ